MSGTVTQTTIALAPGQNEDGTFSAPSTEAPAAATGARPEGLPEKFQSVADLAKSYAELEAKFTQSRQPQAAPLNDPATGKPAVAPQADAPSAEPQAAPVDAAAEAAKAAEAAAAGVDMDAFTARFNEQGGKLTDADYAELATKGISKAVADNYIAGQKALGEQRANTLYASIGGQEKFNELATWLASPEGAAAVTADQIDAANAALAGTNVGVASVVLQGLMAKMQAAVGVNPTLLAGKQPGAGQGGSYASFAEQVAAQSDPRYATDPAYQAEVLAKIERSLGNY